MEGRRGGGGLQAQGLRDDALDPERAILTPDPISLTIARDGQPSSAALPHAAERIFMRCHDM
jgi:hypothetical protein